MQTQGDKFATRNAQGVHSEQSGLMSGLAGIVRHLAALICNRVELAALELGELRGQLLRLLLISAIGLIAFCFALACWTGLIIVLAWESMGWTILLMVAGVFTLAAILLLLQARKLVHNGSLFLPATMAELRKDRDTLLQE